MIPTVNSSHHRPLITLLLLLSFRQDHTVTAFVCVQRRQTSSNLKLSQLLLTPPLWPPTPKSTVLCRNWVGDLWEEIIEFSTYGPSERRVIKAEREKQKASNSNGGDDVSLDDVSLDDVSLESFRKRRRTEKTQQQDQGRIATIKNDGTLSPGGDDAPLSLTAFRSAKAAVAAKSDDDSVSDEEIGFDGYKLRDLLVDKWGAPLDVDFQRGRSLKTVYCTVLPVVGHGTKKSRHRTELGYLMHLQAVVEILNKYDNLDGFVYFLRTTKSSPKPGTESVPFRLKLDDVSLKRILSSGNS